MKRRLLLLALGAAVLGGCAQSGVRSETSGSGGQIAPVEYRSAFAGYQPFREDAIAPWPDANEAVKESAAPHGGHR